MFRRALSSLFFFFNDTATTEIYTLSLHDALPICSSVQRYSSCRRPGLFWGSRSVHEDSSNIRSSRSEEHTSELQSPCNLVCRLLLEKKKKKVTPSTYASRASAWLSFVLSSPPSTA